MSSEPDYAWDLAKIAITSVFTVGTTGLGAVIAAFFAFRFKRKSEHIDNAVDILGEYADDLNKILAKMSRGGKVASDHDALELKRHKVGGLLKDCFEDTKASGAPANRQYQRIVQALNMIDEVALRADPGGDDPMTKSAAKDMPQLIARARSSHTACRREIIKSAKRRWTYWIWGAQHY